MIISSIATAVLIMTSANPGESAPSNKQRDSVRKACMADVMRHCPRQAAARDRMGVRACLTTHFSKTSQECQSNLRAVQASRDTPGTSSAPYDSHPSSLPAPKP